MNRAPELAARRASRISRKTTSSVISRDRKMNQDLVQAPPALSVTSTMKPQQHQAQPSVKRSNRGFQIGSQAHISFEYIAGEESRNEARPGFDRDISTKLYVKGQEMSPTAALHNNEMEQDEGDNEVERKRPSPKRLSSMLVAVINKHRKSANGSQDTNDPHLQSRVAQASVSRQTGSLYKEERHLGASQRLIQKPPPQVGVRLITSDIEIMGIRGIKKQSVQHDALQSNSQQHKLNPHPRKQGRKHQRSQNFQIQVGSGTMPTTLSNPAAPSYHTGLSSMQLLNFIKVPNSTTNQGVIGTASDLHSPPSRAMAGIGRAKNSAQPSQGQQTTGTAKLAQDFCLLLDKHNNSTEAIAVSSPKALYNAAKIQRIQIVNKPSKHYQSPNKRTSPSPHHRVGLGSKAQHKADILGSLASPFHSATDDQRDKNIGSVESPASKHRSFSQGKRSHVASGTGAESSHQSPIQASISSYLHNQRFSRDGTGPKPAGSHPGGGVLKQIQTSPGSLVHHTQVAGDQVLKKSQFAQVSSADKKSAKCRGEGKRLQSDTHDSSSHMKSKTMALDAGLGAQGASMLALQEQLQLISMSPNVIPRVGDPLNEDSLQIVMPAQDFKALEIVSKQLENKPGALPSRGDSQAAVWQAAQRTSSSTADQSQIVWNQRSKLSFSVSPSRKIQAVLQPSTAKHQQSQRQKEQSRFHQRRTLGNIFSPQRGCSLARIPASAVEAATSSTSQVPPQQQPSKEYTCAATNSAPNHLPQLQFVVKYADRSFHDSKVHRRADLDLQGSRTHILPLNLHHQNSLYFVQERDDQEEQETQAAGSNAKKAHRMEFMERNPKKRADYQDESLFSQDGHLIGSPTSTHQSMREDLVCIVSQQSGHLGSPSSAGTGDGGGGLKPLLTQPTQNLFPIEPITSSLAWLRKSRRTLGYIRGLNSRRPTIARQSLAAFHERSQSLSKTQQAVLKRRCEGPLSKWDDLQHEIIMAKQMPEASLREAEHTLKRAASPEQQQRCNRDFNQATASQCQDGSSLRQGGGNMGPILRSSGFASAASNEAAHQDDIVSTDLNLRPKIIPSDVGSQRSPQISDLGARATHEENPSDRDRPRQGVASGQQLTSEDPSHIDFSSIRTVVHQAPHPPRTSQLERRPRAGDAIATNETYFTAGAKKHSQPQPHPSPSQHEAAQTHNQLHFGSMGSQPLAMLQSDSSLGKGAQGVMQFGAGLNEVQTEDAQAASKGKSKQTSRFRIEAPGRYQHPRKPKKSRNHQKHLTEQPSADAHFYREYILEKPGSKHYSPSSKRKAKKSEKKSPDQRAPIASHDYSQEELASTTQQSKVQLAGQGPTIYQVEHEVSVDSAGRNDSLEGSQKRRVVPLYQTQSVQPIGQFSGLNALMGLKPGSKQSQNLRSRLQRILSSAASPFRDNTRSESCGSSEFDQGGVPLMHARASLVSNNEDMGTVLVQSAPQSRSKIRHQDGSRTSKTLVGEICTSWQEKQRKSEMRQRAQQQLSAAASKTGGGASGQLGVEAHHAQGFQYGGVKVYRNNQIKEKAAEVGADTSLGGNLQNVTTQQDIDATKLTGDERQETNSSPFEANATLKLGAGGGTVDLVTRYENKGLFDDYSVHLSQQRHDGGERNELWTQQSDLESGENQHKLEVKVYKDRAKISKFKEVSSLEMLIKPSDDASSPAKAALSPAGEQLPGGQEDEAIDISNLIKIESQKGASDENGFMRASARIVEESDEEVNSCTETQMKMTQATPSQFQLETVPSLAQVQTATTGMINVVSKSARRRAEVEASQATAKVTSWRLNNSSVNQMDLTAGLGADQPSPEQQQVKMLNDQQDGPGTPIKQQPTLAEKAQAMVRPGLDKIIPEQILICLAESQDQHTDARPNNQNPSNGPHDYYLQAAHYLRQQELLRKFDSTRRRQREVDFFQRSQEQIGGGGGFKTQQPEHQVVVPLYEEQLALQKQRDILRKAKYAQELGFLQAEYLAGLKKRSPRATGGNLLTGARKQI